jgi:type IV secretory pathway VirB2 component (pilin)
VGDLKEAGMCDFRWAALTIVLIGLLLAAPAR